MFASLKDDHYKQTNKWPSQTSNGLISSKIQTLMILDTLNFDVLHRHGLNHCCVYTSTLYIKEKNVCLIYA